MAGGKETPRQKMIGMMYLVLTALLALNVSKEIINAFVTQDNQMLVNNNNLVEGINGFMAKFSMMEVDPTTKKTFEKWKPKTQKVNKLSNELDDYLIQNLNQMMEESEDKKDFFVKTKETQYTTWKPIESISNKEDYDIATRLFGGEKQSPGYKKGGEIRLKLLELRDSLIYTMGNYSERGKIYQVKNEWLSSIEVLDKQLTETSHPDKLKLLSIYNSLNQPETLKNHDKDQEWQLVKFDYQPIVGAIGVFTELRNQVRMAQKQALELITSKLDGQIMKINKINIKGIRTEDFIENSANEIKNIIEELLKEFKTISIALSGGNSPLPIYNRLSTYNLDWKRIKFFLVDERCVDANSSENNFKNIQTVFLSKIPSECFAIVHEGKSFIEDAKNYEKLIREHVKLESQFPKFDLIILGMGLDGHTASLFPNTKALDEKDKFIVLNEVSFLNTKRITMTYPLLQNAKKLILICQGKEKKEVILNAFKKELPISRLLSKIDLILN